MIAVVRVLVVFLHFVISVLCCRLSENCAKPFVFVDIARIAPCWVLMSLSEEDEPPSGEVCATLCKALGVVANLKKRPILLPAQWAAAWQRYSLAAIAHE